MSSASSSVLLHVKPPRAFVVLNCPEKHNELSYEMLVDLRDVFEQIEKEPVVRVVILTGRVSKVFSAGTDTGALKKSPRPCATSIVELVDQICDRLDSFQVPVIAAINGLAAGPGFDLVLACHLRIASNNATFSVAESAVGATRVSSVRRLAREIGGQLAGELMQTGKTISSHEAKRIGLVSRVVDQGRLLVEANLLANEILELAPLAIRACLTAVTRGLETSLEDGLELESTLFASLFGSNDVREGTSAFLEKRKPRFTGT